MIRILCRLTRIFQELQGAHFRWWTVAVGLLRVLAVEGLRRLPRERAGGALTVRQRTGAEGAGGTSSLVKLSDFASGTVYAAEVSVPSETVKEKLSEPL